MKLPEGWLEQPKEVKANKKEITARINMSADVAGKGLCPECGKPMQMVVANGVQCLCCMDDRIVLPMPNEK